MSERERMGAVLETWGKKADFRLIRDLLLLFTAPVFLFYLFQNYVATPFRGNMEWRHQVWTILLLEAFCILLLALTGRARTALFLEGGLCLLIGLADSYVYLFRGSYLTPVDLFSFGTAMNVAGTYSYVPTGRMTVVTLLFLLWFFIVSFSSLRLKDTVFAGKLPRVILGALALLFLLCTAAFIQSEKGGAYFDLNKTLFYSERNNRHNGILIQAIYEAGLLRIRAPEGYDAEEEREILERYAGDGAASGSGREVGAETGGEAEREAEGVSGRTNPDLIVVMDESFCDPAVLGSFETDEDYMPFLHSMMRGAENAVTGYVNVSVRGGNTPNSEFEFLTSHSLAFFPENTIPYLYFIRKKMDALPWYLRTLGYETLVTHPFEAKGWNRPKVYPLLGFETMLFQDYFEERDPVRVRDYISDESQFLEAERLMENRDPDGPPLFAFHITMQNHSPYGEEYQNFERKIHLLHTEELKESHVVPMENYLSLIRYSDDALRQLVESFREADRKTLILFFGDHQPTTQTFRPIFELSGEDYQHLPEEKNNLRYVTPFLIWANYDIEEEQNIETSLNYLGNLLLKKAGLPLSPYRGFTDEFSLRYPVLSAIRAEDADGVTRPVMEAEEDLAQYERMQYYEVFDDEDSYE